MKIVWMKKILTIFILNSMICLTMFFYIFHTAKLRRCSHRLYNLFGKKHQSCPKHLCFLPWFCQPSFSLLEEKKLPFFGKKKHSLFVVVFWGKNCAMLTRRTSRNATFLVWRTWTDERIRAQASHSVLCRRVIPFSCQVPKWSPKGCRASQCKKKILPPTLASIPPTSAPRICGGFKGGLRRSHWRPLVLREPLLAEVPRPFDPPAHWAFASHCYLYETGHQQHQ